ncbi:MAG: cytochrome c oxidase subunit II [SAR324 cluster bacterium]|uniref:Cytochrome c oxidase subunit 2 n=1 Tax=SAR324 cluster bacterium TaxID=2024889 RepID=A0A2A4T7M5_9DELT|nr:MAG: cytochrome c oxidase subunit II [SAR324 cluster bacterium]
MKTKIWVLLGGFWWIYPHLLFARETSKELHWAVRLFGLGTSPQSTILPANALSREVNDLYALLLYISVGIFSFVFLLFLYIIIRFNHKRGKEAQEIHGSTLLETTWTIIPFLILIVIAVPTVRLIFKIGTMPNLAAQEELVYRFPNEVDPTKRIQSYSRYLEVNVIGHQWWWEFEYVGYYSRQEGIDEPIFTPVKKVTANEAWLPLGVPIKLNLISEDVIHSFWVPRLAGKLDVLPGKENQMQFIVEEEGLYTGQCAEYCGASHALMRFQVRGVTAERFQQWVEWGLGDLEVESEAAERGMAAFGACVACHTLEGYRPYENRSSRIETAMGDYREELEEYKLEIKAFEQRKRAENPDLHPRDLLTDDDRPFLPEKPHPHRGEFRTIAPDLTDMRFRHYLLSGIEKNTKEVLKAWIENPPAIKPETENTVVTRMPPFKGMLEEQTIDDIVEFLRTLKYSDSVEPKLLSN